MIVIELHIDIDIPAKVRAMSRLTKEGLVESVRCWHRTIAPRHFIAGAAHNYGYKPRTRAYQIRKSKRGSPPALVYTGKARDRLLRAGFFKVTAVGHKATGRFIAGNEIRYFWMRPSNQPNKPRELTSYIPEEQQSLNWFLRAHISAGLTKIRGNKRIVR